MSKSVLVIDTPIDCEECPLYDEYLMRCHYLKNEAYGVDALPEWCPLKSLPSPTYFPKPSRDEWFIQVGRNRLICELRGEESEY